MKNRYSFDVKIVDYRLQTVKRKNRSDSFLRHGNDLELEEHIMKK